MGLFSKNSWFPTSLPKTGNEWGGFTFGGMTGGGAGSVMGMNRARGWEQGADPERTADDYNAPWEMELSRDVNPTADNPMVKRWTEATRAGLQRTGANQAATAAGAQRARVGGFARLGKLAPEYWQRLMSQQGDLRSARDSINTTSHDAAFFQGFLGGGGAQAVGQLAGNYRGNTGTARSYDQQSAYPQGAAWDPDARYG